MGTVTTLEGVRTGRFWVTTSSGTRHLVDLDARTVTRYGAPGHEWDIENPNSVAGVDGEPFHYDSLEDVTVGSRMYMEQGGGYLGPLLWRQSSVIVSIESADCLTTLEGEEK